MVLASDRSTRFYLHNYDSLAGTPPVETPTPTQAPSELPTLTPLPPRPPAPLPQKRIFLSLITSSNLPDLVGSINLIPPKSSFEAGEPVQISVTISNIGNAPSSRVWADLYINPSAPPIAPGTPWNTVCGLEPCFGLVWLVPALDPGTSITLTSAVGSYAAPYSIWPGWFARGTTDLYLYVNSWNPGAASGAISESNEANNRAEQHGLGVQGANPPWPHRLAADLPARRVP